MLRARSGIDRQWRTLVVLLGALLGGEYFTGHDLGAMAVILVDVVIITLAKSRAPKLVPAPESEPAA